MNSEWDKLPELISDDSFCRWLRNESGPEEQKRWESWLKESSENEHLATIAARYFKLPFKFIKVPEKEKEKELHLLESNIEASENRNLHTVNLSSPRSYFKRNALSLISFAAVIALTIGILSVVYIFNGFNQQNKDVIKYGTVNVPYGKHELLKLADGSEIILSANSQLRYPLKISASGNVNVWLKGVAFFSVVHKPGGKNRIFRVHTRYGVITDLGTQFVVRTVDHSTSVILVKGKVDVRKKVDGRTDSIATKLKPGEMAQFSNNDEPIRLKNVNTDIYTSWIRDKLVFDETPFEQVIREIERYYGVKIVCQNSKVQNQKISGTVNNSDLSTVLKGIGNILGLKVEHKNDMIMLLK